MGNNFVGHNTQEMRDWSSDVENCADEYKDSIESLYNLIDGFVASDFTGGLSGQFQSSVLEQRDRFNSLAEVLQEISDCIKQTSSVIDDDEAELKQMMDNSSVF